MTGNSVAYIQPGRISPSMLSLSVTIDHRWRAPMTSHPFIPHRGGTSFDDDDDAVRYREIYRTIRLVVNCASG